MRQILVNFLGNVAKFTFEGDIYLRVFSEQREGEESIYFQVQDTGKGIEKPKQTAIFESFTQADASSTREFGGSSLGLTVSHRFCEVLGDELEVESQEQRGSTFTAKILKQYRSVSNNLSFWFISLIINGDFLKILGVFTEGNGQDHSQGEKKYTKIEKDS